MRASSLIAKSVLLEAVRRREIYVVVLFCCILIAAVMTVDFFDIEGITKFYREVALKVMGVATAMTVVALAARQLPREFESRTVYTLLAKPISRMTFLLGKLLGVLLAAAFCFAIFMAIFVFGTFYLGGEIPWGLFLQHVYLQLIMMLILATLSFWLSMVFNLDAAITVGVLFFILASTFTNVTTYLYDYATGMGQAVITLLTLLIPQLVVFDLSEKTVHSELWSALSPGTLGVITAYGLAYVFVYLAFALLMFRRRDL